MTKPFLPCLAAILCAAGLLRAESVSPVSGFVRKTVAGAGVTVLSFPLHEAPVFSGAVKAVSGASGLEIDAASWTGGQLAAPPHLAHFYSGNSTGSWFLITANTGAALTLETRGVDLTGAVSAGDGIEIFAAHTLGGLFGATASMVTLQSGNRAAEADTVSLWNGVKFKKYYFNGTQWTKGQGGVNCNDVVVPPDAGVIVKRRAAGAVKLIFTGLAPDTTERSDVAGPGTTLLANRFPVATTLGALGLGNLSAWRSEDQVMLWKKQQWLTFTFDGANWHRADKPGKVADTQVIPAGSAVLVVRRSVASGSDSMLAQDPPYPVE